ncbi:unnamed protein product [Pleuronectes platessa]|uniref:Uncharacterized protein n=1 Tax=Pleuronectes platessa TaxID=8262 RepID=A0A9N7YMD8_PLEPL|nr:unnamed protein product [Pleuronectes platessa]
MYFYLYAGNITTSRTQSPAHIMADDPQRNFRSAYYEKVGFRGVEEKKSLEILLKDHPLDLEKLSTFSQRFPLPVHVPGPCVEGAAGRPAPTQ